MGFPDLLLNPLLSGGFPTCSATSDIIVEIARFWAASEIRSVIFLCEADETSREFARQGKMAAMPQKQ
jgi:hypothetical protein